VSKIISTAETKRSTRLPFKKIGLVLGAIIAVGLIIFAILYFTRHDSLPFVAKSGCSEDKELIEKYQTSYRTGNGDGIKQVNETILARSKYKEDPTCLYILTRHAFLFGNQDKKELFSYFDMLKASRKNGQDVSKSVNDDVDRELMYKVWQQMQDGQKDAANREVDG
jgi:hypothetical protein